MVNVYAKEIDKFSKLTNDWWNPDGSLKTLHALNPTRLTFIEKNSTLAEKKVIDVGCGGGLLSESLAKKGAKVTGIDLAAALIDVAAQHAKESDLTIHYECMDVEDFSKQHAAGYDILTCMELLEHVPCPSTFIAHCAQLLKPGGLAFFSTVNRNLQSYLSAIIGAEYILQLLPKGTHDYQQFIRPSELDEWALAAGLKAKAIRGVSFNPFKNTAQLSDDVGVNYLMCFEKC